MVKIGHKGAFVLSNLGSGETSSFRVFGFLQGFGKVKQEFLDFWGDFGDFSGFLAQDWVWDGTYIKFHKGNCIKKAEVDRFYCYEIVN